MCSQNSIVQGVTVYIRALTFYCPIQLYPLVLKWHYTSPHFSGCVILNLHCNFISYTNIQSGAKVIWYSMFNMLPLVSSNFLANLYYCRQYFSLQFPLSLVSLQSFPIHSALTQWPFLVPAPFCSLNQSTAFLYPVILILLFFFHAPFIHQLWWKSKKVSLKRPQISTRLHDSTSQMTAFFIK